MSFKAEFFAPETLHLAGKDVVALDDDDLFLRHANVPLVHELDCESPL